MNELRNMRRIGFCLRPASTSDQATDTKKPLTAVLRHLVGIGYPIPRMAVSQVNTVEGRLYYAANTIAEEEFVLSRHPLFCPLQHLVHVPGAISARSAQKAMSGKNIEVLVVEGRYCELVAARN